MTVNSNKISALAVDGLQRERRAANIPQRALADELGISRQTVNQKLQSGDMKLTEFVTMAFAVGASPHEILAKAEALAEGGE